VLSQRKFGQCSVVFAGEGKAESRVGVQTVDDVQPKLRRQRQESHFGVEMGWLSRDTLDALYRDDQSTVAEY
jgi:hypothetical protein